MCGVLVQQNKASIELNQGKRKAYKKRAGAAKKRKQFNMKENISSPSSSSDVSEE